MYFSRRNNPPHDTIRSFRSAEYQPALLTYAWKSYSRFVNTGAATRTRPFRLSPVLGCRKRRIHPSSFAFPPPPPSIDEIRCSTKFDRLSKGRGNNRNFSTMEPRISRLKRSFTHSFIRLSWCISNVVARNSNKWRTLGCFYHLLPPPSLLLSKLKRTP